MTLQKDVLSIVPGLQATALVGANMKLLKKPSTKNFVKVGVANMTGIALMGPTATMINKL